MIINSLLDSDYYKFTMAQFVFNRFPDTEAEYEFICRTPNIDLSIYSKEIHKEIENLCGLRFTQEELDYLKSLKIFHITFIDFLKNFKFNINSIRFNKNNGFGFTVKGSWLNTILFETPLLAIISGIYCKKKIDGFMIWQYLATEGENTLSNNISLIKKSDVRFADFGTRRRFSREWHNAVIDSINFESPNNFIGTSNVLFAKKYNLKPIGTMAHELLQAGQVLSPFIKGFQRYMLDYWAREYPYDLRIALTDVLTTDCFLEDFNGDLTVLYKGLRQDSGDPMEWGEKIIRHYESYKIDPTTKTAIFSDGLTFNKMIEINNHFKGRLNCIFGIGTNLTNDVGMKPLNIVIKMTECNGKPVAKISDSPGKSICKDKKYLRELKKEFGIE